MGSVPARIKELFVANAEDYTWLLWLLCHSLIAAKTDPRGFQNQDVYLPCTQTNKMCIIEQNPEMLISLFVVAVMASGLSHVCCWHCCCVCAWVGAWGGHACVLQKMRTDIVDVSKRNTETEREIKREWEAWTLLQSMLALILRTPSELSSSAQ